VVSDEVRKLAENTTTSIGDIDRVATEISSALRESIAAFSQVKNEASDGLERQNQADLTFKEIATAADRLSSMANEIASGVREQTASMELISRNVETLGHLGEQGLSTIGNFEAASQRIDSMAKTLDAAAARFRLTS
jgi:methyl-accepting chemotaxis protein